MTESLPCRAGSGQSNNWQKDMAGRSLGLSARGPVSIDGKEHKPTSAEKAIIDRVAGSPEEQITQLQAGADRVKLIE